MLPPKRSNVQIPEELKDKVIVGRIIRPRGLKGELRIQDFSGRPFVWEEMQFVLALRKTKKVEQLHIKQVLPGKGNQLFLRCFEIDDIDRAEEFKGSLLFSERENMPDLEEDEFYVYEMVGAEVVDREGNLLGHVTDVQEYPAHNVFIVVSEKTGNRFPIPSVREFVKEIDIKNGKIVVEMIQGLDDLET